MNVLILAKRLAMGDRTFSRTLKALLLGLLALTSFGATWAAEYFVSVDGSDDDDGLTAESAFATIQKGIDALNSGDALTIGPGEYFESVERKDLGSAEAETVIQAAIPGSVLLRGDVSAPTFEKVDGYRFVHAAPFDTEPQALMEVDTMKILPKRKSVEDLEFEPGCFFQDAETKRLHMSSSDMRSPDSHHYQLSVTPTSGIHLINPIRVTIDGLAVTGFNSTATGWSAHSVWGIRLDNPVDCVIRNCVTFLNGGGITLWGGGHGNLIEDCVAYGNWSQTLPGGNIRRFGGNDDVIRNCHTYRSKARGISFYGKGDGQVLLENVSGWGNALHDFRIKGHDQKTQTARGCVTVGQGMIKKPENCMMGRNDYNHSMSIPNVFFRGVVKENADREFADPANYDFRLQSTSRLRGAGENGVDIGARPYRKNVFFVGPDGDDQRDGTSTRLAWKTLFHAFSQLNPGDTLYLEPAVYDDSVVLTSKGVSIRGRGVKPTILTGTLTVKDCEDVELERLNVTGSLRIVNGSGITLNNCVVADFAAEKTNGAKVTHCVFAGKPRFAAVNNLFLSSDVFAEGIDVSSSKIVFSDYNAYPTKAEMNDMPDDHSLIIKPKIARKDGALTVANSGDFAGRGWNGTAIGVYLPFRPKEVTVVGPFIHSVGATTANLEWWTSTPATCELAWWTTDDDVQKKRLKTDCFGSYSLTGLKPGTKYSFAIRRVEPKESNYNINIVAAEPEDAQISFQTATQAAESKTYYVATDGDDQNDGLGRKTAWRTIKRAADTITAGDAVMIAGGVYEEAVTIRSTGAEERPITFKAIPGETVTISGADKILAFAFKATGKNHLRFDGLRFKEQPGAPGVLNFTDCDDVGITRCMSLGPGNFFIHAKNCEDLLIKNCVMSRFMEAVVVGGGSMVMDNCVSFHNLIMCATIGARKARFANNVFCDSQPFKIKVQMFLISQKTNFIEENNCYYLRLPDEKRKMFWFSGWTKERGMIGRRGLAGYEEIFHPSNSVFANPWFKATVGMRDEGRMGTYAKELVADRIAGRGDLDFNAFFVTNPELVERKIGLQPEAFDDFKFKEPPPKKHMAPINELRDKAKAAKTSKERDEFLSQAAILAGKHKEYDLGMNLAEEIKDDKLSKHAQMSVLYNTRRHKRIVEAFKDVDIDQWPENVCGDSYELRGMAHLTLKNGEAAEADLKSALALQPENQPHLLLKLGDNYRNNINNGDKAVECYRQIIEKDEGFSWRAREALAKAVGVLVKQKRLDEADEMMKTVDLEKWHGYWKAYLLGLRADIDAAQGNVDAALSNYAQALKEKGISSSMKKAFQQKIAAAKADANN